jgi:hypothetical protein
MRGSIAFPVRVRAESPRRGTTSPELRSCAIVDSLADTSAYVCLRVPAPRAPRSSSRRPFHYAPPVPHPHTHACTSSSCTATSPGARPLHAPPVCRSRCHLRCAFGRFALRSSAARVCSRSAHVPASPRAATWRSARSPPRLRAAWIRPALLAPARSPGRLEPHPHAPHQRPRAPHARTAPEPSSLRVPAPEPPSARAPRAPAPPAHAPTPRHSTSRSRARAAATPRLRLRRWLPRVLTLACPALAHAREPRARAAPPASCAPLCRVGWRRRERGGNG